MPGGAAARLLNAPRVRPDEAALAPAIDALGGEVVRLRSRDGLGLRGRWLPADRGGDGDGWQPDPYEAILLLHGWTGSVAPDLVELGPSLRRTAGVLGLDFGGHGGGRRAPATRRGPAGGGGARGPGGGGGPRAPRGGPPGGGPGGAARVA